MATADRNRNRRTVRASASQRTRLPALNVVDTGNPALNQQLLAIREHLQVREGLRGNPFEQVVTRRDLVEMGLIRANAAVATSSVPGVVPGRIVPPGAVLAPGPNNTLVSKSLDQFAAEILNTSLFRDLNRRVDDPTRFDHLTARVRNLLTPDVAAIDGRVRADIRRIDQTIQDARESIAVSLQEQTAAVLGAAAGVRQVAYATASANRATAGQVTTITARLDDFDGGGATVEESMSAIVDRVTGAEAKYSVKVSAGGAVTGFGLISASNTASPTSAFIIQANKFAIVDSSYSGGLDTTPAAENLMFGVDADGAYIYGNIKAAGQCWVDGETTSGGLSYAAVFNNSGNSAYGISAKSTLFTGVFGTTSTGFGVHGFASGAGSGVLGNTTSASGVGGEFTNSFGGVALHITEGSFRWGNETYSAPDGDNEKVLGANGNWLDLNKAVKVVSTSGSATTGAITLGQAVGYLLIDTYDGSGQVKIPYYNV